MADKLSREEVRKVAFLARLEMSDEELDRIAVQLGDILEYASVFEELDTKDVEPTSHVIPLKNVFREDKVEESATIEEVLKNAPDPLGDYFCVPKILDEGEGQ